MHYIVEVHSDDKKRQASTCLSSSLLDPFYFIKVEVGQLWFL